MFLQEIMVDSIEVVIRSSDAIGIDTHFIRYLHLALFDSRLVHVYNSYKVLKDVLIWTFGILPLFIMGLRFWTAPVYLKYSVRMNSFALPLTMPIVFFCEHLDMMLLGGLCFFMNIYVFWYHVDPPTNVYGGGQYTKYRGPDSDDDSSYTRNSKQKFDYADAANYGLQAMATGLPIHNPYAFTT